jgi:hypothetical protein
MNYIMQYYISKYEYIIYISIIQCIIIYNYTLYYQHNIFSVHLDSNVKFKLI